MRKSEPAESRTRRAGRGRLTTLWIDDYVDAVALRTGDFHGAVALLFLVDPALKARLVDPLGRSATLARRDPLGRVVVVLVGKAHPTVLPSNSTSNHITSEGARDREKAAAAVILTRPCSELDRDRRPRREGISAG